MDSQTINTIIASITDFKSPQQEMDARQELLYETIKNFPKDLVKMVNDQLRFPPLRGNLSRIIRGHTSVVRAMCLLCVLGDERLVSSS